MVEGVVAGVKLAPADAFVALSVNSNRWTEAWSKVIGDPAAADSVLDVVNTWVVGFHVPPRT
jgi:hypothetical protein